MTTTPLDLLRVARENLFDAVAPNTLYDVEKWKMANLALRQFDSALEALDRGVKADEDVDTEVKP